MKTIVTIPWQLQLVRSYVKEHFSCDEVFAFQDGREFKTKLAPEDIAFTVAYEKILSKEELEYLLYRNFAFVVIKSVAHREMLKETFQFNFDDYNSKNDHPWWLFVNGEMIDCRRNYPGTWRERH